MKCAYVLSKIYVVFQEIHKKKIETVQHTYSGGSLCEIYKIQIKFFNFKRTSYFCATIMCITNEIS